MNLRIVVLSLGIAAWLPSVLAQSPLPDWARDAEQRGQAQRALATHPYRIVEGQTNTTLARHWFQFHGDVLEVHRDGIRVRGFYRSFWNVTEGKFEGEFYVKHFPYAVAEGDSVGFPHLLLAKPVANFRYATVMGGTRVLHCLDYGVPCTLPTNALTVAASPGKTNLPPAQSRSH